MLLLLISNLLRLETKYPMNLRGGAERMRMGEKFLINSVEGDAFAWICRENYGLTGEEIEFLRKEIFLD